MPNVQGSKRNAQILKRRGWLASCLYMNEKRLTPSGKPYDIHERLLEFAVEIVNAAQFLHTRGPIGRALSYQLLSAGTSTGSNAEESDGASSHDDFIAKNRIALKEGKESRFRLRVCRRANLLDARFNALVQESDELVRIIAKIVQNALRNSQKRCPTCGQLRRARRRRRSDDESNPEP